MAICLCTAVCARTPACAAEWEDAVLTAPPGTGWEFLWNCDSMSVTQDQLVALRSRLRAVVDSGKTTKANCAATSKPCSEELDRLRETARRTRVVEDSLRERLGRQAAGCPAPGWARLLDIRTWSSQRDSACPRSADSVCSDALERIAQGTWKATILSGRDAPPAFDALHQALLLPGLPHREAIQLRLAILLDRRGSLDSARALRQAIIDSARDPRILAAANLWMGVDASIAKDQRARCLHAARSDSGLARRALIEIADLLEASDRPREAADTLASWIRATGSVRGGPEPLQHLARLTRKARIHPDSFQIRLGASRPRWADTLYLLQASEELRAGELNRGMSMLAGFHVRFPGSALAPAARDLLGKARRRDPEVVGSLQ